MSFEHNYEAGRESLLTGLNPEQKKAVLTEGGPILILAGAGSGKTRVITHRIAHLILDRNVPSWRILAITFTNKAANEMRERAEALVGEVGSMWIGTFHTMMLRILRRDCERVGFRPDFSIIDTDDQRRAIKEVLVGMGLENTTIPLKEFVSKISSAKNEMISPDKFKAEVKHNPYLSTIASVYAEYVKYCRRHNGFDFDDILLYTLQLLQENEDIRERYQERFLHILVDEYQDTNKVQYELVKLLSAKHRNLTVVGDDDQSIYRFRGADITNILDFEDDYPDATVIRLEQNYRSTKTILNAANAVIAENEARKKKRLWTDGEEGAPITFYLAEDHSHEARFVVRDIRNKLHSGSKADFAVLYRASALTRNIESSLREYGISYQIFGGLRFYDRKEIKDVTAYMRLALNQADDLALIRIINTPKRGIGDQTLEALRDAAAAQGISMLAAARQAHEIESLQRYAAKLMYFVGIIDKMTATLMSSDTSFAAFIEEVIRDSGLAAELEKQIQTDLSARTRLENMQEMASDALEFEKKYLAGEIVAAWADEGMDPETAANEIDDSLEAIVRAYLEQSALYSDQDRQSQKPDVNLMTIHSAKGLEFDHVYLIGAEERIFPSPFAEEEAFGIEEERRLCYVAMTRAKKQLTITAARSRLLYGRTQYNPPSRFLATIPDDLVNEIGGKKEVTSAMRAERSFGAMFDTMEKLESIRRKKAAEKPVRKPGDNGILWTALSVGQAIQHTRFGQGEILAITPTGDSAILRVRFASGEKRFVSDSADLSL